MRFVASWADPPSRLLANYRYYEGKNLEGCSPAPGGPGFWWRGFVSQFNYHNLSGEFLGSVEMEVDGGALGARLGHHAEAILDVLDVLALREWVAQETPLGRSRS